jgi:hypothetical protein
MKSASTVAVVCLAVAAVACAEQTQSSAPRTGPTPVAGTEPPSGVVEAQNQADQRVVDRLAAARCEQEEKCDRIGTGRKYASRYVCETQLRSDTTNGLNAQSCPRGIDQGAVDHCLKAIQAQPCAPILDTFTRITDCRAGAMCMK